MREVPGIVQPAPEPGQIPFEPAARAEWREMETRWRRDAAPAAAECLQRQQAAEGYWNGLLTADATLESDYILLQLWLNPPEGRYWPASAYPRIRKAVRAILDRQLPDGGWNIYAGGPSEVNATARAYIAMKLAGQPVVSTPMQAARQRVLDLGGLQACNSYTKINLSLYGLYPRRYVPSIPPEITLVPGDLLYEMSSWTRAIIVPLSVVQAVGVERPAPEGFSVEELLVPGKSLALPKKDLIAQIFNHVDRLVKLWERRNVKEVRKAGIRECERWMLDRTYRSDGIGAIYPAMMYSIMALDALGYPDDHPDLVEAKRQFDGLIVEDGERLQFKPCHSPVWDTAIAMFALGEMGIADPAAQTRAADWLLAKEVRRKGDWSVKRPELEPGGWAFEFANEYYPDIDDTAMVLLAFGHASASDAEQQRRAEDRAIRWLLGMQSSDGGWAAFDYDNNWELLNKVPFADHNAMLDPTCPDITGRVLEALCRRGLTLRNEQVRRAVEFLLAAQKDDGSWFGRWGVNYIYGTFLALRGLRAAGGATRAAVQKAVRFLQATQNPDGGWGETCDSYREHRFIPGPSTASQTAWALLGLAATGEGRSDAALRGAAWLLDRQQAEGRWDESETTGTGFPNVFYLTYHLYRQYFPMLALATVLGPATR